jgi:serine/threonine-protein kinase
MKLKAVSPTPPNPQARATTPAPAPAPAPAAKGGGFGGIIALVLVFAVLGGLGWAVTVGPLKDKAHELLASETEVPVVDNGPRPIDATASPGGAVKPAWVREKEEADRLAAEETARQKEVEAAANDPERKKLLEEIQAQLQQLNTLEEEQHQLKIDARAGKATGEANTNKIADLQKQIDEMKKLLSDKQQKATPGKHGGEAAPGDVQVVRDARSAKNAEVGYVTLRTFNPDSSSVTMEDGTALGSTPLVKVPLDVGVHKLKLIDSEGKVRTLSVSIEAGKELKLPAVDVGSLP